MSFDALPVELYEAIFGSLAPEDLQRTVLAVNRAIPFSPVPIHHLYHHICIRHPDQAIHLHQSLSRSLRKGSDTTTNASNNYSHLDQIASWINEITIESWVADAEVLINIFQLLRRSDKFRLQSLNVWIGPSNFTPEHLEELFKEPLTNLSYLSLRFRPYVQRATYMQFLKGTYFDSTLKAIALWPFGTLPVLSIIQDPFDATGIAAEKRFAQPLVFFRLDVASFMRSSALRCLTSLRFRIPARPVARALCNAPSSPSSSLPLPDLEFIDLSNTAILENEIDSLLVRLPCLKHIVLDNCNIFRGEQHPNDWRGFGKRCALIGVQRSKEREKVWKEYLELRDASHLIGEVNGTGGSSNEGRKIKPGRRGLATATISLRGAEIVTSAAPRRPLLIPADAPTAVPALGPRSTMDQGSSRTPKKTNEDSESITPQASTAKPVSMPFPSLVSASLQDIQAHYNKKGQKSSPAPPSGSQKSSEMRQSVPLHPKPSPPAQKSSEEAETVTGEVHSKKSRNNSTSKNTTKRANKQERVRVLPPLPSLISLCVTLPPTVEENDQLAIQNHFGEGWVEGIKQLEATRARLRTSAANGVRVVRFAVHSDPRSMKSDSSESEGSDMDSKGSNEASEGGAISSNIGLHGLVDIDRTDPDAFGTYLEGSTSLQAPILCFAGPGIGGQHMDNCGHSVAWKIMKDNV